MKINRQLYQIMSIKLLALFITACGGGGGDSTDALESNGFTDPLYAEQWHLNNVGQSTSFSVSANAGIDINVVQAWNQCSDGTCLGQGVNVGVIDNGIELTHPDLRDAIDPFIQSYDYISNTIGISPPQNSSPNRSSAHGTSIAGIIAAQPNEIGGVGIAPSARLVVYNPIAPNPISNSALDTNIANALTRDHPNIHIYNNSWGDDDSDLSIHPARSTITNAIEIAATSGNQGRGSLIVFASGNGASIGELSSYDGNLNTRHSIVIGGLNASGTRATSAEYGANLWLTAPSGDGCNFPTRNQGIEQHSILTTDLTGDSGINFSARPFGEELSDTNYTRCFGQSNAAAAMVSGVAALIMARNPSLTARDVRFLLANSARRIDETHSGWQTNAAGFDYNVEYGFGLVNAGDAVQQATRFSPLPPLSTRSFTATNIRNILPGTSPLEYLVDINNSLINTIEWVEVTVTASGGDARTTGFTLTRSGSSVRIPLSQARTNCASNCGNFNNFTFGVAGFLGEVGDGRWILEAQNLTGTGGTVTINQVTVTVYGH